MTKDVAIAQINKFKGQPIIITTDENLAHYANTKDHWLLYEDNGLVIIEINRGMSGMFSQAEYPFCRKLIPFDSIVCIQAMIPNNETSIDAALTGLTPVGTDDTLATITAAIKSSSVRKAHSPYGISNPKVGSDYGKYQSGSVYVNESVPNNISESMK